MATIFNIQHFSLHDGPGIRTTCFFSGCNLRCQWCHNPESFTVQPRLRFWREKCIGCGRCFAACSCHSMGETGHCIARDSCHGCGNCAAACPANALELTARQMEDQEILAELLRDQELYSFSGGGVTFSGGEPLLHPLDVARLAEKVREAGIHVSVDSAACVPWESIAACIPVTDLFLFDLKAVNPEIHKAYTGVGNEVILNNIQQVAGQSAMMIRVPVISGVNDSLEEMSAIAQFLGELHGDIQLVELLSYHDLGTAKYPALGLTASPFSAPSAGQMQELATLFDDRKLTVSIS